MRSLIEKFEARGVAELTDEELLSLLVEDRALAVLLLEQGGSLAELAGEERSRLRMVGGMGLRRAQLLHLAAEFGRRVAVAQNRQQPIITSDADVVKMMRPQLEHLHHEECWVLYLTTSNRLIEQRRISQGGVQGTVVDHRLIVKRALELLCTRFILLHNHPSGSATPSEQDKQLTRRICEAAALFDIRLLDHIVLAREGDFSFKRAGLL